MSIYNGDPLLGGRTTGADPLSIADLKNQLARLEQAQQQRVSVSVDMPQQALSLTPTVWDDIRQELDSMTDTQKALLFQDEEYQERDRQIGQIAARYQMSLLMPYVIGDKDGKRALEAQLHVIREKKDDIVRREAAEQEEFRRWKAEQIAGSGESKTAKK